jgi:hypothetical protein
VFGDISFQEVMRAKIGEDADVSACSAAKREYERQQSLGGLSP